MWNGQQNTCVKITRIHREVWVALYLINDSESDLIKKYLNKSCYNLDICYVFVVARSSE